MEYRSERARGQLIALLAQRGDQLDRTVMCNLVVGVADLIERFQRGDIDANEQAPASLRGQGLIQRRPLTDGRGLRPCALPSLGSGRS